MTLSTRAALAVVPLILLQACVVEQDDSEVGAADDSLVDPIYEDDCEPGELRFCDQNEDPTVDGEQRCLEAEAGYTGWTECAPREMNGPDDCYDDELWDGERCVVDASSVSTPIVLSFERTPVRFASGGGDFDLTGSGFNVRTDWPTAATPWLALDRDGNGRIDDGSELFGSATRLSSGALAKHGFEALAELDDNGDGQIDVADAAFGHLLVWRDANGDRRSEGAELQPLDAVGVTSLSLAVSVTSRCDAHHNCERERATFYFRDATGRSHEGQAVDVYLGWQ